jgi:hypothetical protein
MQLQELKDFFKIVQDEGSDFIKNVLNKTWYEIVKEGAQKTWMGEQEYYDCKYFPVRWLMEEGDWPHINSGLIRLERQTNKRKLLKNKLQRLVLDDWMQAMTSAFEIAALCRFAEDRVLIEIEPKINPDVNNHADALIQIDKNGILVELTSMTKELANPKQRVGTIAVEQMVYQVISKIKDKAEKQLIFAEHPVILIISLPPRIGSTQLTAKWAVEEVMCEYPKISAILISDSYRFRYGACYFNELAEYQLNEKEANYISKLLLTNR